MPRVLFLGICLDFYYGPNPDVSNFRGSGPLMRPSATRWYLEALDSHGVASRFRRPSLRALVLGVSCATSRLKSIDEPCAMKPRALGLLSSTRPASTYFPPRYDPLQDGPHGPLHPGQIFLACSRFSHLLKRNKTWDTSARVIAHAPPEDLLATGNWVVKDFPITQHFPL